MVAEICQNFQIVGPVANNNVRLRAEDVKSRAFPAEDQVYR